MKLELTKTQIDDVIASDFSTDRRPLTLQEEDFIRFYVEDMNGSRAYEKAYYNGDHFDQASSSASHLLGRPEIGRRVAELIQSNLDFAVSKSPSMLLRYIERFLELDISNYYDDDGRPIPLSQLRPEDRVLISNVSKIINNRTGSVVLTYVLPEKARLLEQLGKLVSLVTQVKALSGNESGNSAEAEAHRNAIFQEEVPEASFSILETKIDEEEVKEIKKSQKKKKAGEGTPLNTP